MERVKLTDKYVNFVAKAKEFVEDKILDADIVDSFFIGSILGSIVLLNSYWELNKTRFKNNLVRASESRRVIAPLNPRIVKDVENISKSAF